MARTNKCKICGWDGTDPQPGQRWLGTNHNLCSLHKIEDSGTRKSSFSITPSTFEMLMIASTLGANSNSSKTSY